MLLGYSLAVYFNDVTIFPRFGALVICVGIYFTVYGLEDKLSHLEGNADSLIDILDQNLARASESSYAVMEDRINKFKTKEKEFRDSRRFKLVKVEAGLAIIGTFIWAFGDLLVFVK